MSLVPPETVKKLQATLHAKAKDAPSYRFYSLYDKVYRRDVLAFAYRKCRANGGAPGVDGQTFADIEVYGGDRWLDELTDQLRTNTYRPAAVRRSAIPKRGQPGRVRPLGIPTIRDRVVETAAVLVLEPIFEADLQPEQYAYRPGGPFTAQPWLYRGRGCGLERILRWYSPRRLTEIGGTSRKRSPAPAPEKAVAGSPGGRNRRTGTDASYDAQQGHGTRPSQAKFTRLCREVSRLTGREWTWLDEQTQVERLNHLLIGWANYFCLGRVRSAYRTVNYHAVKRLRQWFCCKHKVRGRRGQSRFSDKTLHEKHGLVHLERLIRNRLRANARGFVRKPDAGNLHVRFDERGVETEQGRTSEAPTTERIGNR